MAEPLTRLRSILGPDWTAFLGQLRADLRLQRDALAQPGEPGDQQRAAHVVAALAGTADDAPLAASARRCLAGDGVAPGDLVAGIDRLLARLDGLAAGAAA